MSAKDPPTPGDCFDLQSDDDIVNWMCRVAEQPELRVLHGAHVHCQPAMLIEAADEIQSLRRHCAR